MGACISANDDDTELIIPVDKENFNGLVKQRTSTDVSFLVFFLVTLVTLFGLVMYCTTESDTKRFFYGYDECGNICGYKNEKIINLKDCTNHDMTSKPFLKIDAPFNKMFDLKNVSRECVASCQDYDGYEEFLHRCVLKETNTKQYTFQKDFSMGVFIQEILHDLQHTLWEIMLLSVFALILSLGILVSLKYVAAVVVWFVLACVVVACISTTVFVWFLWNEKLDDPKANQFDANILLFYAFFVTIITIVITIIIVFMKKRIALVIQLFKEAGKALQRMPLLLGLPLVTLVFISFAITTWSFFALLIQSSGRLVADPLTNYGYYQKDFFMKYTRFFNIIVLLWVFEFIIDCQHMIIAGTVATWFFTRNKNNLSSPISTSTGYLLNYHLGSVAMGSLIITTVKTIGYSINIIGQYLQKSRHLVHKLIYLLFKSLFRYVQRFLEFLTRNAYVEIAIYGDNFCNSGVRAFKVILSRAFDVYTINFIGTFILYLGKLLVIILNVLVGYKMLEMREDVFNLWVPLFVIGIVSYLISHCCISVFEMVVDTVFVCSCEDYNLNKGDNDPQYYTSPELMKFIEDGSRGLKFCHEVPAV